MFLFKKMCHPWKYDTQIVTPLLLHEFTGRAICSIHSFCGMHWVCFLISSMLHHFCALHDWRMQTRQIWKLKRYMYKPQLLYHTKSYILLVRCMHHCCKGHKILSWHPSTMLSIPLSYPFQFLMKRFIEVWNCKTPADVCLLNRWTSTGELCGNKKLLTSQFCEGDKFLDQFDSYPSTRVGCYKEIIIQFANNKFTTNTHKVFEFLCTIFVFWKTNVYLSIWYLHSLNKWG